MLFVCLRVLIETIQRYESSLELKTQTNFELPIIVKLSSIGSWPEKLLCIWALTQEHKKFHNAHFELASSISRSDSRISNRWRFTYKSRTFAFGDLVQEACKWATFLFAKREYNNHHKTKFYTYTFLSLTNFLFR